MPTGDPYPHAPIGIPVPYTEHFPEVLTPEEAARYLRVSPATLRKAVRQKDFPVIRVAGRWRVAKSTLDAYLSGELHQEELGLSLRSKRRIMGK